MLVSYESGTARTRCVMLDHMNQEQLGLGV